MLSSKFEIKKEFDEAPKMVKLDHPGIPCCGFECPNGYVQFFHKTGASADPANIFLLCSNSKMGCTQKMYLAYGTTNCMDCNKLIKKVFTVSSTFEDVTNLLLFLG